MSNATVCQSAADSREPAAGARAPSGGSKLTSESSTDCFAIKGSSIASWRIRKPSLRSDLEESGPHLERRAVTITWSPAQQRQFGPGILL